MLSFKQGKILLIFATYTLCVSAQFQTNVTPGIVQVANNGAGAGAGQPSPAQSQPPPVPRPIPQPPAPVQPLPPPSVQPLVADLNPDDYADEGDFPALPPPPPPPPVRNPRPRPAYPPQTSPPRQPTKPEIMQMAKSNGGVDDKIMQMANSKSQNGGGIVQMATSGPGAAMDPDLMNFLRMFAGGIF